MTTQSKKLPNMAIALTGVMSVTALAIICYAVLGLETLHSNRALALFVLAVVTARMKVKLPGLTGNMSVNLPFLLIAATQLTLLEALIVALPACAVQCLPRKSRKPNLLQMLFNLSTTAVAVGVANFASKRLALVAAACFFLLQTIPVASIIAITEGAAWVGTWSKIANLSFPFYVLSAGMVSLATASGTSLSRQVALLGTPVLYAIYRSYESYFEEPGQVVNG